jgi:hypothetical protein
MARITYVKKAQPRYHTTPVIDPETGKQKVVPVLRSGGTQKVTKSGKPVVMKVTVEDKSRPKPLLVCESCGKPIEIGTPYKHVTPRSGPFGGQQRNRHADCPNWKPSELSSSKMATVMAAQESFAEQIGSWGGEGSTKDDVQGMLDEVAEAAREVANEYRESAEAIKEHFPDGNSNTEEWETKADDLDSWADDLDSALDGVEDEPTIDHEAFYVINVDGSGDAIEESFESREDAEVAMQNLIDQGAADEDAVEVEERDAEVPSEEEWDTWCNEVREAAENTVDACSA